METIAGLPFVGPSASGKPAAASSSIVLPKSGTSRLIASNNKRGLNKSHKNYDPNWDRKEHVFHHRDINLDSLPGFYQTKMTANKHSADDIQSDIKRLF